MAWGSGGRECRGEGVVTWAFRPSSIQTCRGRVGIQGLVFFSRFQGFISLFFKVFSAFFAVFKVIFGIISR